MPIVTEEMKIKVPNCMHTKTKARQKRWERFMPNNLPRYVHVYDNGGMDKAGGSCDRYTVVFTGNYAGREGCDYLSMSGAPFHPQGIGQSGWSQNVIDSPSYGHLGKKIHFKDLPEDCQILVLRNYLCHWQLVDTEGPFKKNEAPILEADAIAKEIVGARVKAEKSVPV